MTIEFFGRRLSGPFTIPSGIVTCAPSIIQYFLDHVPEVGIITTKSIGMAPRTGNREPVLSQYAPGCFVNAVGLTNPGAERSAEGPRRAAATEPTTSPPWKATMRRSPRRKASRTGPRQDER